jgi:hypothetical protein
MSFTRVQIQKILAAALLLWKAGSAVQVRADSVTSTVTPDKLSEELRAVASDLWPRFRYRY